MLWANLFHTLEFKHVRYSILYSLYALLHRLRLVNDNHNAHLIADE